MSPFEYGNELAPRRFDMLKFAEFGLKAASVAFAAVGMFDARNAFGVPAHELVNERVGICAHELDSARQTGVDLKPPEACQGFNGLVVVTATEYSFITEEKLEPRDEFVRNNTVGDAYDEQAWQGLANELKILFTASAISFGMAKFTRSIRVVNQEQRRMDAQRREEEAQEIQAAIQASDETQVADFLEQIENWDGRPDDV